MSGNLFDERNWLLPPNYLNNNCKNATSPKSPIRKEPNTCEQEKCGWGPNCPLYKNQEKEDWDGKHQSQHQKVPPQSEVQKPRVRHPQNMNYQKTSSTQKQEADMERLNSKYNLDCFSNSNLDSDADKGEQYQYEHGYETLI